MADQLEKSVHLITVFADNFQFQLHDQLEQCEYPEDWSDALLTRLFACGESIVGVGTVRDLDCDITIEVYAEPMDENKIHQDPAMDDYDHVAQCNMQIPSGKLMISGCTTDFDDTEKIDVSPGQFGVRIFWSNLEKTDTLGFEGEDEYLIQLYPETYFDEVILKFWRQLAIQLNTENN